jgi:hypothetical protein
MNWTRGLLTGLIAGPVGAAGMALFSNREPVGLVVTAAAIAVGSAIGVAYVSRTITADVGGNADRVVQAAAADWRLKNMKASPPDANGAVTLSRGTGLFGDSVKIAPSGGGVRLTGPASIVSILKKLA